MFGLLIRGLDPGFGPRYFTINAYIDYFDLDTSQTIRIPFNLVQCTLDHFKGL